MADPRCPQCGSITQVVRAPLRIKRRTHLCLGCWTLFAPSRTHATWAARAAQQWRDQATHRPPPPTDTARALADRARAIPRHTRRSRAS